MRFPAVQEFEHRLRFDKVTESLKVGTFLRHSAVRSLSVNGHSWTGDRFLVDAFPDTDLYCIYG